MVYMGLYSVVNLYRVVTYSYLLHCLYGQSCKRTIFLHCLYGQSCKRIIFDLSWNHCLYDQSCKRTIFDLSWNHCVYGQSCKRTIFLHCLYDHILISVAIIVHEYIAPVLRDSDVSLMLDYGL